jgi:predicted enzyme related to lactoylglutathione lyase
MATIGNITFACEDPAGLAGFWAAALDYEMQELPDDLMEILRKEGADLNGAAAIIDPTGKGPRFFFEKKEKSPTTSLPLHLDLNAPDPDKEIKRLQDLGAQLIEKKSRKLGPHLQEWTVMQDPEGNGFCIQG